MIGKRGLPPECIIDRLKTDYRIAASALTLLPLGADVDASVYKAETQQRFSYFVKLKRGHGYDIGVTLLALLQMSGIKQIIPPVRTIHGELTKSVDGFTLIVYPFIEGENGFCYNLTDDQWITLGKVMRQVHAFEVPGFLKEQIRKENYSPKWREAVRLLYASIDKERIGDEWTLKFQKFMKENRATIQRLVDRAEFLSQKARNQSSECVLCHSDIHGGNVLLQENGTLYIVDWDDPILAPKERDLMFIGGGVANIWNNPDEEIFFYKGYGKTEINQVMLAYYRHERIVEDIAVYGQQLLLTEEGDENRLEMYKQFIDMFEPRGVVDVAFKTDSLLV